MDVEQAIATQRVVRRFSDQPLSEADEVALLEAGRHTGSSKNLQRWQFIVVRDRARLVELSEVGAYAGHLAGAALAIALVTPDPRRAGSPYSIMWDSGRAAQNMTLVAWSRGIGSAPATVYDQELCRSLLGYPDDQHCEFILSFGHPADPADLSRAPRAGGRRRREEIVHRERW
jgi:nitroreductase